MFKFKNKVFQRVVEGDAAPVAAPATIEGDSWLSALPEDLQTNPTLQEVKSVEALAKRFIDTKAMVGNSVRVPGTDAPAEDLAAFRQSLMDKNIGLMAVPDSENEEVMQSVYKSLGQPDEASDYKRPENWSGMTDEKFGFLAGQAHKAGMSKTQFEKMSLALADSDNEHAAQFDSEYNARMDELKGEWGNAYQQKVSRASNIAKQLDAPEGLQKALSENAVDAMTLRWLDNIAEKFGKEGGTLVSDEGGVNEHTPSELRERVTELTKKMLTMNISDPQYQPALKKRLKYLEMLNPEK